MSTSRRKGNALETWVARRLHAIDGVDPALAPIQTPTGRLGNTYRLQADVASQHFIAECKNREDNPLRLWEWQEQLTRRLTGKMPLVFLKRNRRDPLVVLTAENFFSLFEVCQVCGITKFQALYGGGTSDHLHLWRPGS